jgi:hypothetical protein
MVLHSPQEAQRDKLKQMKNPGKLYEDVDLVAFLDFRLQ